MFDIDLSLKPIIVGTVLVALMVLEIVAPMFHSYDKLKQRLLHDASNIFLGVCNAVVASFLFVSAVVWVTTWAAQNEFGVLNWLEWNPYAEALLGLLIFDCWQYCWHRLNHHVSFLWRFHAVHHSDAAMDASSAVRFHTVEIMYSSVIRLAILPLIGLTLEHMLIYELILLPIILFHHSNIAIPAKLDKVLRAVIVTPRIHWVHHSHLKEETNSNYASLLSVWDRLFGTFKLREDPKAIRLGLGDRFDQSPWSTVWGMLKQPFNGRLYKKSESE